MFISFEIYHPDTHTTTGCSTWPAEVVRNNKSGLKFLRSAHHRSKYAPEANFGDGRENGLSQQTASPRHRGECPIYSESARNCTGSGRATQSAAQPMTSVECVSVETSSKRMRLCCAANYTLICLPTERANRLHY